MTDITTDTQSVVDAYFEMWNTEDEAARLDAVRRAWTEDARYVDPLLEADGHEQLVTMVAGVHGHYPGHRFRRTSAIDAHHDQVRFAWELVAPDGTITVGGIDVGELAADGKLRRITGFFGDLEAAEA